MLDQIKTENRRVHQSSSCIFQRIRLATDIVMRLLHTKTYEIREFRDANDIPPYAILSHTWTSNELYYGDLRTLTQARRNRQAFQKIEGSAKLARCYCLDWIWIDTCSIDKTSSAELSEAIISMFGWYQKADICLVYLSDVGSDDIRSEFKKARWFTRGWTLQELLAPCRVEFFNSTWLHLGSRDFTLKSSISIASGVPEDVICGQKKLEDVFAWKKWLWTEGRETTRPEDQAYCLLGLFDVSMPALYGEGEIKAFERLRQEISRNSQTEADHDLPSATPL